MEYIQIEKAEYAHLVAAETYLKILRRFVYNKETLQTALFHICAELDTEKGDDNA